MAREFVSSRSLQPIKAVVLGPPWGGQSHACKQASSALSSPRASCIQSPEMFPTVVKDGGAVCLLRSIWVCANTHTNALGIVTRLGLPVLSRHHTPKLLFALREKLALQISRRYGLLHVDTKIAVDGVFEALGRPLPPPISAEEKAPQAVKGKKAKDTKKGMYLILPLCERFW